jgi:fucose permease
MSAKISDPQVEAEVVPDTERADAMSLHDLPTPPPTSTDQGIDAVPPIDRGTLLKLISAGYSYFCAGVNDGSLGPLIPYLLQTYNISTNFVSIVYGITFFGWFFAAVTNSHLTQYLDLAGMLVLGACLQLLAHVLRSWLPPFGLFAATFFFAHLGQAYQDAHGNTYVSSVKAAHRWLGFIHAMYMAGCLVGPFVSTAVAASNDPSRWNLFYTFPLGLCVINVIVTAYAFRDSLKLKKKTAAEHEMPQSRNRGALKEMRDTVRIPSVWLLSLFYFFYLGAAITAGGKTKSSP